MALLPYCYQMDLTTPSPDLPFTEEEKAALADAIEKYNASSLSMANPKEIELVEVSERYISLKLFSTQALTTPGRGLSRLTTLLLDTCLAARVVNKHLLRVIRIQRPTDAAMTKNPASTISDIELIKALLDYITTPKDSSSAAKKKRAAIEDMKRLGVQGGLL